MLQGSENFCRPLSASVGPIKVLVEAHNFQMPRLGSDVLIGVVEVETESSSRPNNRGKLARRDSDDCGSALHDQIVNEAEEQVFPLEVEENNTY